MSEMRLTLESKSLIFQTTAPLISIHLDGTLVRTMRRAVGINDIDPLTQTEN
jgi:hypothetical protein